MKIFDYVWKKLCQFWFWYTKYKIQNTKYKYKIQNTTMVMMYVNNHTTQKLKSKQLF